MKQVETRWLVMSLLVAMVVVPIRVAEQVTSKPNDGGSSLMRFYCSTHRSVNVTYILSNLNITLSSLRRQLTISSYAAARNFVEGDSVWGLAWCRAYLSVTDCLVCFDYAINQLKVCGLGDGALAIYNDCDVRYGKNAFYTESNNVAGVVSCDGTTSPQPIEFRKAAEGLLLDLQIVAPRTTNFYAVSQRKLPVGNSTVYAIAQCKLNISDSVCIKCLRQMSQSLFPCLPTILGRAIDNNCFMRYDTTQFFGQNQNTDISILLSPGYSSKKRYIIGVVVGSISTLSLAIAFFIWRHKWKRTSSGQQVSMKGTTAYNYNHLQLATDNFSEENLIGKGGFGEVFKAILDDKKVVAVKKLKVGHAEAKVGFQNEISLISNIHHRNLLGLLGWSSEGSNLLLVLEYMTNGSLDRFLWGEKRGSLTWKRRYDIILGIARGLAHLHKEFHIRIVHRDIKSSNILLDDDYQPKIADFGLARFQPEDQSHVITKFAGTLGYTAPEYIQYGFLSEKVDTFSFGIVILEIISGRKCTYRNIDTPSSDCLLEHAWKLYENHTLVELVDQTIDVNPDEEKHVIKIIEIALLCTQSPASKRPAMSEVVLMLPNDPSLGDRQLTRPNFSDENQMIHVGSP